MRLIEPPILPPRPKDTHKGRVGRLLILGGSVGMSGAVRLAAEAAFAAGAGLVICGVSERIRSEIATGFPDAMVQPLPATLCGGLSPAAMPRVRELLGGVDALLLGPGAGRHPATRVVLRGIVERVALPLVIDADGLRALSPLPDCVASLAGFCAGSPRLWTPHPGEAAGLLGEDRVALDPETQASRLLARLPRGDVLLLKGPQCLVARNEERVWSSGGNPALSVAGAGDVLAGIAGALLAVPGAAADPFAVAAAAVWLHRRAAELLVPQCGVRPLTASALIAGLRAAVREREAAQQRVSDGGA